MPVGHVRSLRTDVATFSFLTNHALVLLAISHDSRARMRDIAATLDITERATQRIVGDLVEQGYLSRTREGRRNIYEIRTGASLEVSGLRRVEVGQLLEVLAVPRAAA